MKGNRPYEGWRSVALTDIAELSMGETLLSKNLTGDGIPVFSANTDEGPWGFTSNNRRRLCRGDIVIGARGSIGFPRRPNFDAFTCTQTTIAVQPDCAVVDSEYLHHALCAADILGIASQQAVPMLTIGALSPLEIALPKLDEQRRIAEVLQSVDGALAANEAVAAQAHRAFQTALTELIGSAPDHWETVRLSQIAELTLGKMLDKEKNKGELRPYLANVNVRWGAFDLRDLRHMRFEERELDRYGLHCGDIVMCEGGEPGRCAVWMDEGSDMMIQKALHRIRPNEGVDNHYLYYALVCSARSGAFDEYMTGSGIKHLPGNQLAKVEVSLPPLDEQQRIAGALRLLEQAAGDRQSAFEQAQAVKQSIMSDLLSGRVRVPA